MDEQQSLPEVHEAWLPKQHPLHRPRHGGLQIIALVCALVFFAMPAFAWTVGMRAEPIGNRPMAPFPSVSQG